VFAVATVFPFVSMILIAAPDIPVPLESTTKPIIGFGTVLTRRLSMRLWASLMSRFAGWKVTPAIAQDARICLPFWACTSYSKAFRILIAVFGCPLLKEDWAEDSLLVSALATSELSIQPTARSCPTTFEMLVASANTVTLTDVECVNAPTVPVTVRMNVDGVTKGCKLTLTAELADPPAGGVTGLELNEVDTPLGSVDALKLTGELKPLTELTVVVKEPEPAKLSVIGELMPIAKSVTVRDAVPELPT